MNNNTFSTDSMFLANTLITIGYPIQSLDNSNPSRIQFVFNDSSELRQTIEKYWSRQLQVEPIEHLNNLKTLKSQLFAVKK